MGNRYECVCEAGYTGENCEEVAPVVAGGAESDANARAEEPGDGSQEEEETDRQPGVISGAIVTVAALAVIAVIVVAVVYFKTRTPAVQTSGEALDTPPLALL